MNPSGNNKNYDELISKAFGRNELAFDFDKWQQSHPDAVREYQSKTQSKTNGRHKTVALWRTIMKNRFAKLTAAAVIIVASIIGISAFDIQPDGANIAWAQMLETMKAQQWIHAVGEYEDQDESGTAQAWVSLNPMIMAHKQDGKDIAFYDLGRKISQRYNYEDNVITIDSMEGMSVESFNSLSPVAFIEMMIQGMQLGQDAITSSFETREGENVEIITSKGPDKTSTIVKDVQSGLIISATTSGPKERFQAMAFDYPEDGPADVFALGVPEDAQIIDNRPTGDIKELTDILNRKCKEGFGDFQAIVLISALADNGTPIPKMVLLMQGKDKLKRVDSYCAFDTTGRETKRQTIYDDIKDSWPDLSIEAVLAIDNAPAIMGQALFNGSQTITCFWSFDNPGKVEKQAMQMDTFGLTSEWLPLMVWRLPLQLRLGLTGENKAFEAPEMDKEHFDKVGLRVRTTVRDTQKGHDEYSYSRPRAGIRDYWFDPARDHILVEEIEISENSYDRVRVLDFARTDKGQLYPSVIQIYSGDNADDPAMGILQQNIVIDTSPVFEPGTFTVETMLQDK